MLVQACHLGYIETLKQLLGKARDFRGQAKTFVKPGAVVDTAKCLMAHLLQARSSDQARVLTSLGLGPKRH